MIPPGARVFVIDDDASFVRSTVRLLRSWGIRAEGFTSAREFLGREPAGGPACVLADVRMPGVNGPELQEALWREHRRLPVLFISGYGDAPPGAVAPVLDAVGFLAKPVDERRLLQALEAAFAAAAACDPVAPAGS